MTRRQLYRALREHRALKYKRHPMFDRNRFMRFLMVFMWLYYAALLLLMGTALPFALRNVYPGVASFHVLDGFAACALIADFWLRFLLQETPAQQARPYSLLPVRRSFLLRAYLWGACASRGNLFWFFGLVPFGLLSVAVSMGWGALLGWLLGWWLLFVANSLAYLLCRALCMRHPAWALLPAAVHGAAAWLMCWPGHNLPDQFFTRLLYGFARGEALPYLGAAAALAALWRLNYRAQRAMVRDETAGRGETATVRVSRMAFLDRYGKLGEYLKLEVKIRTRNRSVRVAFLTGVGLMAVFSLVMYFSSVYDNAFMTSFICLYDYLVLGLMTLATVMCHEGNYIDGLTSRRESILQLLRAKYLANCLLLLLPLAALTPLMCIGKMSVGMNLGYLLFTAGVIYPLLFQGAVYNRNTLPLNTKLTGGNQGSAAQQVVSLAALFVPIGVERAAALAMGEEAGHALLMALGLAGVAASPWWLRSTYRRMMSRRHVNMEGFRASRNS